MAKGNANSKCNLIKVCLHETAFLTCRTAHRGAVRHRPTAKITYPRRVVSDGKKLEMVQILLSGTIRPYG
jgi:hypothetical protein